ncbi:GtrA family protein [Nocardia jejuensis]|uniref:GtrA family protein n=1 Tax=Nocardia jejuensis TaxID=328049 RepID=UPI000A58E619|nr:GtrA family protein [Nocardia jejuensis]
MSKTAGSTQQKWNAVAAFARFVVCGGSVTMLSATALILLDDLMPLALANALLTIAGTFVTTELNARFAFQSGPTSWTAHLQAAATVLVAYLVTTGAMLGLADLDPNAGALTQQAVYLTASGLAGIARFLVLRAFVLVDTQSPNEPPIPHRPRASARLRGTVRTINRNAMTRLDTVNPVSPNIFRNPALATP